ncbi:MAG: hypothetical protein QNJ47_18250 [Nostocaceae cyanobacterium]|nr:hypothetical protein [Nostocaceae cyanobacterium]
MNDDKGYTKTDLAKDLIDNANALRKLIDEDQNLKCRPNLVIAYKQLSLSLDNIHQYLVCWGKESGLEGIEGYPLPELET